MATTPAQRDEAARNQVDIVYPVYGAVDDSEQRPPNQPFEDSYRDQWYTFSWPSRFELRPTEAPSEFPGESISDELTALFPIFIMSAWNPRGEAQSFDQNLSRGKDFSHRISRRTIEHLSVTTFANDGGWIEQSSALTGVTQEQAAKFATDLGQPAFVRWDSNHLTVIPTEGSNVPPSQTGWNITKREQAPCPMRNFARDTQCVPAGGPWVGASQLVGAVWQQHRGIALSSVGCGVCDTGAKVLAGANGMAIPIRSLNIGSRYGGYFFSKRQL